MARTKKVTPYPKLSAPEKLKEYKIPKIEQEVVLRAGADDEMCVVDVTIPKMMTKLKRAKWKTIGITKYKDGSVKSMIFKAPLNFLSFRDPGEYEIEEKEIILDDKPKRVVSEEQIEKMQRARELKQKKTKKKTKS